MQKIKSLIALLLATAMIVTSFTWNGVKAYAEESDSNASIFRLEKRGQDVVYKDVQFYVPETIYLEPQISSAVKGTQSHFQWFVDSEVSRESSSTKANLRKDEHATGEIYFYYPEARECSISYRYIDKATGETIKYATSGADGETFINKSTSISIEGHAGTKVVPSNGSGIKEYSFIGNENKIMLTKDSIAPHLAASDNGCYIEWTVTYFDQVDESNKTVTAYSYVYKPLVQPVGAAVKCNNDYCDNMYNSQITWASGVHKIADTGNRVPKSTGGDGSFVPFASTNEKGIISGRNFDGSDGVKHDSIYAQFSNGNNNGVDNYFDWSTNNTSADHWLNTPGNDPNFKIKSFVFNGSKDHNPDYDASKCSLAYVRDTSPISEIYVDSSRYTNLREVPNLSVGFMVTDDEGAYSGRYSLGFGNYETFKSEGPYADHSEFGKKAEKDTFIKNYWDIGLKNGQLAQEGRHDDEVKYNGKLHYPIDSNKKNQTFIVDVFGQNWNWEDTTFWTYGDESMTQGIVRLNVHTIDKASLRNAVLKARFMASKLGIKADGSSDMINVDSSIYKEFKNTYIEAEKALGTLDYNKENPGNLADRLLRKMESLDDIKKTNQANGRVMAIVKNEDGSYSTEYVIGDDEKYVDKVETLSFHNGDILITTAPVYQYYEYAGYSTNLTAKYGVNVGTDYKSLIEVKAKPGYEICENEDINYTIFYTIKEDVYDILTKRANAKAALDQAAGENPSDAVKEIVKNAKDAIDASTTSAEISKALEEGLKAIKEQQAKEEAERKLSKAKEDAIAKLEELAKVEGVEQSEAITNILSDARKAINAATNLEEVYTEKEAAADKLMDQLDLERRAREIQKAKEEAKQSLRDEAGENPSEEMKDILKEGEEAIDQTEDMQQLDETTGTYLEKIAEQLDKEEKERELEKYKEEAKKAIDDLAGDNPSITVNGIAKAGKEAVDKCTTYADVQKELTKTTDAIIEQQGKEEEARLLKKAKADAIDELVKLAGKHPSDAMENILSQAKTAINTAGNFDKVAEEKGYWEKRIKDQLDIEVSRYTIPATPKDKTDIDSRYTVPADSIIRDPADTYAPELIRKHGSVTFTVIPDDGGIFKSLLVDGVECTALQVGESADENIVKAVAGKDHSMTITVSNVTKDITLEAKIQLPQVITATADKTNLKPQDTAIITALSKDKAGNSIDTEKEGIKYIFESTNPSVAKVDQDGNVQAVAAGTTSIKVNASAGMHYQSAEKEIIIQVSKNTSKLEAVIAVSKLEKGKTSNITAISYDQAGNIIDTETEGIRYTYTSANTSVAKVDASGKVTAVGAGRTSITVTASEGKHYLGSKASVSVEVTVPAVPENINVGSKVIFSNGVLTMTWSKIRQATGYEVYAGQCGKDVKLVATVKGAANTKVVIKKINGAKLSAQKSYRVYVKAYKIAGGTKTYLAKSLNLHVVSSAHKTKTNVNRITLTKNSFVLSKGKTAKIKGTITKASSRKSLLGHTRELRFWTMNKAIATVDANGVITAKKAGVTTIYVMAENGVQKAVKVTVK